MGTAEVGTLRWDRRQARWQRWSGRRWLEALYSRDPEALQSPQDPRSGAAVPGDRRAALLEQARADQVLAGATVVEVAPLSVTLARRQPVSHTTHLLLTLVTAGAWGFVWLVMVLDRKEARSRLEVDPQGHVWLVESA